MKTRIAIKGCVVLPVQIQRKLGLRTGDSLDGSIENGRIVLTPRSYLLREVSIVVDPITRLPVLSAGQDAPPLSGKQVRKIRSEVP